MKPLPGWMYGAFVLYMLAAIWWPLASFLSSPGYDTYWSFPVFKYVIFLVLFAAACLLTYAFITIEKYAAGERDQTAAAKDEIATLFREVYGVVQPLREDSSIAEREALKLALQTAKEQGEYWKQSTLDAEKALAYWRLQAAKGPQDERQEPLL